MSLTLWRQHFRIPFEGCNCILHILSAEDQKEKHIDIKAETYSQTVLFLIEIVTSYVLSFLSMIFCIFFFITTAIEQQQQQ